MRFNCFPKENDVLEGLDRKSTVARMLEARLAIEQAITETEQLTGEPIRVGSKEVKVVMGKDEYFLPQHPVRNVQIPGLPQEYWHTDEPRGVILAKGFGVAYSIIYDVGYGEGQLPSAHQALILRLARALLGLEDLSDEEKNSLVLVIKRLRCNRENQRNELKTSGTPFGKGLREYSPS